MKSAKDGRYVPVSATFRDRTIAEGSGDGYIPPIFSRLHTLHLLKFDQCQML